MNAFLLPFYIYNTHQKAKDKNNNCKEKQSRMQIASIL
jgi:hypothetical protein